MSQAPSILNDVLGPVMRGPSSSHTAGSYHLGKLLRFLLSEEPAVANFAFDPDGSYAQVYRQQGSDLGFAAGLLGWEITDERFPRALMYAAEQGVWLDFRVKPLPTADHPNTVQIEAKGQGGRQLRILAKSVGGGAVVIGSLQAWSVHLTGKAYELLVELEPSLEPAVCRLLIEEPNARAAQNDRVLLHFQQPIPFELDLMQQVSGLSGVTEMWTAEPIFFPLHTAESVDSAAEMIKLADQNKSSLGQTALAYEARLLGLPEAAIKAELLRRYQFMAAAVQQGLSDQPLQLQLLQPSARQVFQSEAAGRLAVGGLHTRAAARAMAVMHVNGSGGVVCAAPTAGAAGTLPAVLLTLAQELGIDQERLVLAMLAAGAVGLVVAARATFAAELAGCQVEIGAAGAMAAAAVVEAAAISFQNTMGSVCDLVQGIVEIPCHTRNALAASSAFVCADLVLGGYYNPVSLDETVAAVFAVGKMLPRELRCTALGGLAQTPSALALPRTRRR